jgi:hypothetical protein
VPMVGPLKKILRKDWIRRGQPASGPIVVRSVDSGKWQARADTAWKKARLARVTLIDTEMPEEGLEPPTRGL